jgi:outer membrane protein
MRRSMFGWAATLLTIALPLPALAQESAAPQKQCDDSGCTMRATPEQVLAEADRLVAANRFDDAAPLLAALEATPQFAMERRFLLGYSSMETGKTDDAIKHFRAALAIRPDQTRVRLELARALESKGKLGSADYQYRLAEEDGSLPDEVLRTVHSSRGLLRDRRNWSTRFEIGIAPDSNINNGTNAESVDINFGPFQVPVSLDGDARRKTGIGQSANVSTTYRTSLSGRTKLLIDADTAATNYKGKSADDFTAQLAVGPEWQASDRVSVSLQAIGSQHWYGGKTASQGGGARAAVQLELGEGQRVGVSLDGRYAKSGFSDAYNGWNIGGQATYERVVARSLIASATLFGRRDLAEAKAYSGFEYGANLGIGGELPLGINAGISGGVSRATFDGPLTIFSIDPRKDWRLNGRAFVGLRRIRVLGFSPSVTYNFSQNSSSLPLYDSERHKVRFGLARYF